MDKDMYLMLRKAAIPEFRESYTDLVIRAFGFDYRTINCLIDIIDNEKITSMEKLRVFFDKSFYNMENMIRMYQCGLQEIIPTQFFEEDEFLARCAIDRLPDNFCKGNKHLKKFTIKQHIKTIGHNAFADCINLKSIGFSWDVRSIGNYAFKNCSMLDLPEMAPNLTDIGKGAFIGCNNIFRIKSRRSIRQLREETFMDCENLEEVCFPGLRTVGDRCFKNCRELKDVEAVFSEIGKESFANCTSLRCVEMDGGEIRDRAFINCPDMAFIKFVHVPYKIGADVFCGCEFFNAIILEELYYKIHSFPGKNELFKDITLIEEDGEKKLSRTITSKVNIEDIIKQAEQ